MKKLIYTAYVAVLIVMGAATFIEAAEGTLFVHREIYGAWWFTALWAVLALAGITYFFKVSKLIKFSKDFKNPDAPKNLAVFALHASFLFILAGALLTHLTGRSGTIHLRLGEPQTIAEITHNGSRYLHRLNFSVELTDFQIIEDGQGNVTDYRSSFRILPKNAPSVSADSPADSPADSLTVSMNNIARYASLRFYQMSYDHDLRGSTLTVNYDPYGIPVTYCGYALLFLSFVWLCLSKPRTPASSNSRDKFLVPVLSFLLTAAWCVYYFLLDGSWSQIPVLRHPLLVFHVVVIILAYALLLIQTVVSAAYFCKGFSVPKAPEVLSAPAPPACNLLRWALCLLSIGIFIGAIWANISWGNYWSWDSKETWALITLMIYAIPVHRCSLPVFRKAKVFHSYMLLAFLAVLMTYFGVNYFLVGLHSYG